jgi:hypothetical protein
MDQEPHDSHSLIPGNSNPEEEQEQDANVNNVAGPWKLSARQRFLITLLILVLTIIVVCLWLLLAEKVVPTLY